MKHPRSCWWALADRYIIKRTLRRPAGTLDRFRRLGEAATEAAYKTYVRVRVKHAGSHHRSNEGELAEGEGDVRGEPPGPSRRPRIF